MMHLCISKSGHHWSDNGLLPTQHQAIIWTNVGLLKIGPLETIFSEIWMYSFVYTSGHCRRWRSRMEVKIMAGSLFVHCKIAYFYSVTAEKWLIVSLPNFVTIRRTYFSISWLLKLSDTLNLKPQLNLDYVSTVIKVWLKMNIIWLWNVLCTR